MGIIGTYNTCRDEYV